MPAPVVARQPETTEGRWFAGALARQLLREELGEAIPALTACYGKTGLYLRPVREAPEELSGNLMQRVLRVYRDGPLLRGDLACLETELPLQRECVDLAYLLHPVEAGAEALPLLEELERVLAPEGNLMLVMLNPWSPWRLRWAGQGLRPRSAATCARWLQQAGFEIVRHQGLGPLWPWSRPRLNVAGLGVAARDPAAAWRASFLLQARKRRRSLTPVRPQPAGVALAPGMEPG